MKIISTILATLMLYLTAVPCGDEVYDHQDDEHSISVTHEHDHNGNSSEDDCSPLCVCQCCHTALILIQHSIRSTETVHFGAKLKIIYKDNYSSHTSHSIWHPPKTV